MTRHRATNLCHRAAVLVCLAAALLTVLATPGEASTNSGNHLHSSARLRERAIHAVVRGSHVRVSVTVWSSHRFRAAAVSVCLRRDGDRQVRVKPIARHPMIRPAGSTFSRRLHLRPGRYTYRACVRANGTRRTLGPARHFSVRTPSSPKQTHSGPKPSPTPTTSPSPAPTATTAPAPTPTSSAAATSTAPTGDSSSATSSAASTPTFPGPVLTPEQFGAVGDGVTDDTLALQRALDAVPTGGTLQFSAGKVYVHSNVLKARAPDIHITGAGTLLATNESRSSFWIMANNIVVDGGLVFRTKNTTQRWNAFEQMGVRLAGVSGTVLRDISVQGSAAAGIFVGQSCCTAPITASSNFLIEDVTVTNTRADGIHMTGGAHDGTVLRATVIGSGDDGVAVVSYSNNATPCSHILIDSPTVRANTWGRGVSVVGGQYITYRNVDIVSSNGAAIYIADEKAYLTMSAEHIVVDGGTLSYSNADSAVKHGAIMLNSARAGYDLADINISGLKIDNTRTTAPWQVALLTYGGGVSGVNISDLQISGALKPFYTNLPAAAYHTVSWTVNGSAIANQGTA